MFLYYTSGGYLGTFWCVLTGVLHHVLLHGVLCVLVCDYIAFCICATWPAL